MRGAFFFGVLFFFSALGIGGISPTTLSAKPLGEFSVVRGKHIVLKADFGTRDSLSDLVEAFDAAVPQFERFFQLPEGTLDDWTVDAFVMEDQQRFRDSGDLPDHFEFPFGYAISGNLWVHRQQSDYYTRHLLLHEGVHALSIDQFGGTGPSWFAEGLADLLGVHAKTGADVRVNVVPQSRSSTPYWGRFKLMSRRRAENRIPTLDAVLRLPPNLKSDVESYGWSWLALLLLTDYPEYREAVMQSTKDGSIRRASFTAEFKRRLQREWPIASARWRMLAYTIDYGFDRSRERLDLALKDPLWDGRSIEFNVDAAKGWQSTGVRFSPGMRLQIAAEGRCKLDDEPRPWVSEPQGVTIHYHNDRPLGQLLLCRLPNRTEEQRQLDPLQIETIESQREIVIDKHCWLLFRINDYLDGRGDNEGGYKVIIRR